MKLTVLIAALVASLSFQGSAYAGENPLTFSDTGGDIIITIYENDLSDDTDDTIGNPEERATKLTAANGTVTWTSASHTFECVPGDGYNTYWYEYEEGKWVEMIPI